MKKVFAILLLTALSLFACPEGKSCDREGKCEKSCPKEMKACPHKGELPKACPTKENCHAQEKDSCSCATKCMCEGKETCECKDDCSCVKCKAKKKE